MNKTKVIIIAILAILSLILLIQNSQVVMMHFLFWSIGMSLIIWLIFALIIGFAIGYILKTIRKPQS